MNYALIISAISCLVGLSGAAFAVFARWKASVEKSYAAQRDFAHLQRNFEQLNANLKVLIDDQSEHFNRLYLGQSEIRTMLMTSFKRKGENE